jgi:glucokinase
MPSSQNLVVGIEIGGTKLQLGIGRGDGEILALERRIVEPARGAAGVLAQIREAFPILVSRASAGVSADHPGPTIRAVGVGFGGPVDVDRGVVLTSHQVSGWDQFPLGDWIRETLGVAAVEIQNDADTAGLAEARFGAGQGMFPLLYVTIGSGIGGALILDGRIYRGAGRGAAEIGHIRVPEGSGTNPPRFVDLEQVASGWGIGESARQEARARLECGPGETWTVLDAAGGDVNRVTAVLIAQAAADGDPTAVAVLDRARQALAFALNQAITLLGPRRIILGGGVSLIGERLWFEPIRAAVDRDVFPAFQGTFDIQPAALGEEVVVHGALALAYDHLENRFRSG